MGKKTKDPGKQNANKDLGRVLDCEEDSEI